VFLALYGALLLWTDPGARIGVLLVGLLIPAAWFVIPGLTSNSPFSPGDLALNQHTAIHGSKFVGVLRRWRNLYELPMQLAFAAGVAIAIWRRDREVLGVAAAALLWVAVEIAFALHGWSAASRYLIEPAAACIVIAAALVGQLLGGAPWARPPAATEPSQVAAGRSQEIANVRGHAPASPGRDAPAWLAPVLAWGGPLLVVVLGVSLIPSARLRVHDWRVDLPLAHANGRQNRRLIDVVQRIGGGAAVRACGKPATIPGTQSTLAWAVGLNVGEVSNHIGRAIDKGKPVVAFSPHDHGWHVRVYNQPPAQATRCGRLRADTAEG
jgi:hypothetical protein